MKAIWMGTVIADSDATVSVEGNSYFPPASVDRACLRPSNLQTVCPWKGTAGYYDIVVADRVNPDAAWYYADPKPEAMAIKDYIAFWKGVRIED